MPFFNSKKRRSYINDAKDSVSVKAGDRLDRLRSSDNGPFAGEPKKAMGGLGTGGFHPAAAETGGGSMTPEDHGAAAEMHQSLADLYGKYKKPGTDTIPHTAAATPSEKSDLSGEIDMGRK